MTAQTAEDMLESLRAYRALLLACEAIGWLHMAGKAHPDFLRRHSSAGVSYKEKDWHRQLDPDWSARLSWLTSSFPSLGWTWPSKLSEFLQRYDDGRPRPNAVGLLQAGHAMASGIEKNLPKETARYLGQDATHMWLATAYGHPVRNLLADPPEILGAAGWTRLIARVGDLLDELQRLGTTPPADVDPWWRWRDAAIGNQGWLRQAFVSTLAETRLPNNDVTLWDQSYVAAALFKSAAAGLVLSPAANWQSLNLKSQTRWRVLTVAFGSEHYEARAVRIGDWAGAQQQIESFFDEVCRLVEVDLAVGSLLYRDDETLAFSFPGQWFDGAADGSLDDAGAETLRGAIENMIDVLARDRRFETPPLCRVSASTRSLIPMAKEVHEARRRVAVPIHRRWAIQQADETRGHVCPVCRLRFNGEPDRKGPNVSKQRACKVCRERRKGRLDSWLTSGSDTIWISEVADENDRVALITLGFDLGPWLDGSRIDSLRAQSIADWRRFNPVLEEYWQRNASQRKRMVNPIEQHHPFQSLRTYIESQLDAYDAQNLVLASLQDGYRYDTYWPDFFHKVVQDRSDAPAWNDAGMDDQTRALWLAHQLFRKNASPGRTYRFWRTAEAFFAELVHRFREMASSNPNRWRTRRLVLTAAGAGQQQWEDRETYAGRYRDAPYEVLYRASTNDFVTICNLARVMDEHDSTATLQEALRNEPLKLTGDDGEERTLSPASVRDAPGLGTYSPLVVLDQTPARCRVLVPLSAVNACIDAAVQKWEEEFARVADRMPLRVGVVAFPRMTPFQAVIEAARSVEEQLGDGDAEWWRVVEARTREGVTSLRLVRPDGGRELALVSSRVPDGRVDTFYPFLRTEDATVRHARDFATPSGAVYRHVMDLRPGDGVEVSPSRIALQFMDSTAVRFDPVRVSYLGNWTRLREVWALLKREAPSTTALRAAWAVLAATKEAWRDPVGALAVTADAWTEFTRPVLAERLGVRGAALDALVEAAACGALEQTLEWHLRALKEPLEERA